MVPLNVLFSVPFIGLLLINSDMNTFDIPFNFSKNQQFQIKQIHVTNDLKSFYISNTDKV